MNRRLGLAACALVLLAVTGVSAQVVSGIVVSGTVVRVDQPSGVIVLDSGQMYRATPQTVFLVNNRPMSFSTIQPGTPVVVQYAQPVIYRDGQYVLVSSPTAVAPVAAAPMPPLPAAGIYEVSGIVRWVGASDPGRQSITFDDGRQVWLDENTQAIANGSPAMASTLRPGTFVVVRSSKPFGFRNNVYYTTTAPAGVVPAPAVSTTPGISVVSGTVLRVDQPNVIVLSDGRTVPATTQTVVYMDNRPVPVAALQPGVPVIIYPNGQTGFVTTDPYAFPRPWYPGIGLREMEMDRNSP
jgi:hypothetical protein